MTIEIFPSENDVGGDGRGKIATENVFSEVLNAASQTSHIVSGYDYNLATGLTMSVDAGEAIISGYRVVDDAAQNITVNDDEADQCYFLVLTRDADGLVDGTEILRIVAPPVDGSLDPDEGVRLVQVDAAGGIVFNYRDERRFRAFRELGSYTGNGTTQTITLGYRPQMVIVCGDGTAKADIVGLSGIHDDAWLTGAYITTTSGSESNDPEYRPSLRNDGFYVEVHASNDNLNESGADYFYVAFR